MSKIEVNAIEPQCGTTLTVGAAGTTVTVPSNVVKSNALQASDAGNIISQSGTTITLGATGDSINLASGATQTGFGRTGTVDWNTTPKTTGTFTAVSGDGFFLNTSGGVITANLPAGVAGAIVSFADYAGTWQTNAVTVTPNGTDKIGSLNENATLETEGQSVTFVYVDATQGWINTMDSTSNVRGAPPFVSATGGTITTVCTDYKVHTFTGPGTFTVTNAGTPAGSNTVSYMVVAGGGGTSGASSNGSGSGGGGAGGFRESKASSDAYTASPLNATSGPGFNLPVTATAFPITVGGGGSVTPVPGVGSNGSVSTFSTITSAGGGGGASKCGAAASGGSGAGGVANPDSPASGNTPPTSPPQGQPGGPTGASDNGGGGGGATAPGGSAAGPIGGAGGAGATTSINGSPVTRAGGGGGGGYNGPGGAAGSGGGGAGQQDANGISGTTNTGGGAGGAGSDFGSGAVCGGSGGSGIVIIRYKFQ